MEKLRRCFIALDLPRESINELKGIQKMIKDNFTFTGKFTEPENLHLTLKFLGEIDNEKIEEARKKLSKLKFDQFEAKLGKLGVFSKKNPKILWVELKGADSLQNEIDYVLNGLFKKERRFMGHITIARIKYIKEKKELLEYLASLKLKSHFTIDKFFLKKSELYSEGPVYGDIEEFILEKNN